MHAKEFLHRDITPSNIMLRNNGTPVLIDFGTARAAIGGAHSQYLTKMATKGYAPVEQFKTGEEEDARTDLYALGAVLYTAMTGAPPSTAEQRDKDDDLVPAGQATEGRYGKSLCDAVDWALRLRWDDRPRSIDEWREVLEGRSAPPPPSAAKYSHSPPAPSPVPPDPDPDPKPSPGGKSRRRWLAALGVAAVLAAGGAYYWWYGLPWNGPIPPELEEKCMEYLGGEKYKDALDCYEKVLKLDPTNAEAQKMVEELPKDLAKE